MYIKDIIQRVLDEGTSSKDIATTLGVSTAMISTWKNRKNDFVPRLPIAKIIYSTYNYITYPYAESSLDGTE